MKNLEKLDIVYFVKDTSLNDELLHSLRSIEKNFPHNRVWFIGGCPYNLKPDKYIKVEQDKDTKWANTNVLMRVACENSEITDDFVLFNDDFFVMSPVNELPYYYDDTLGKRVDKLSGKYVHSRYRTNLAVCAEQLSFKGYNTLNYAVHIPMVINKEKMLKCMSKFPNGLMWRSLYGNFINPKRYERMQITDPKIWKTETHPTGNEIFLSSEDKAFRYGAVGSHIKERFIEPSRFEV